VWRNSVVMSYREGGTNMSKLDSTTRWIRIDLFSSHFIWRNNFTIGCCWAERWKYLIARRPTGDSFRHKLMSCDSRVRQNTVWLWNAQLLARPGFNFYISSVSITPVTLIFRDLIWQDLSTIYLQSLIINYFSKHHQLSILGFPSVWTVSSETCKGFDQN
jgi:hypothetical protein